MPFPALRSRRSPNRSEAHWAVHPGLVGLGWVLALGTGTATVYTALSGDRPGAVLLGSGTLVFTVTTGYATVVRPRLSAAARGICIRTIGGTRRFGWGDVRFRLINNRHLGRDVPVLELEAEELLVFGWLELGTDPRDVHDALVAIRRSYEDDSSPEGRDG